MSKETTCCFTGHRQIKANFNSDILVRGIEYLINKGVDTFICGGALGFDTICAQEVLKAKERHPEIKLHIYAPCTNQSERWSSKDKEIYEEILKKADFVDMPSHSYTSDCMKIRNYKMVDNAAYCICYLNNPRSGTGQTHAYAKRKGLTVYNLAGEK